MNIIIGLKDIAIKFVIENDINPSIIFYKLGCQMVNGDANV